MSYVGWKSLMYVGVVYSVMDIWHILRLILGTLWNPLIRNYYRRTEGDSTEQIHVKAAGNKPKSGDQELNFTTGTRSGLTSAKLRSPVELQRNLREDYMKFYNHREGPLVGPFNQEMGLFRDCKTSRNRNLGKPSFEALVNRARHRGNTMTEKQQQTLVCNNPMFIY